jgi:hypothetical protein
MRLHGWGAQASQLSQTSKSYPRQTHEYCNIVKVTLKNLSPILYLLKLNIWDFKIKNWCASLSLLFKEFLQRLNGEYFLYRYCLFCPCCSLDLECSPKAHFFKTPKLSMGTQMWILYNLHLPWNTIYFFQPF